MIEPTYNTFALSFTIIVLQLLWQGLAIASLVKVLEWTFARKSAQRKYGIYVSSMILLLLCVPFNIWLIETPEPRNFSQVTVTSNVESHAEPIRNLDKTSYHSITSDRGFSSNPLSLEFPDSGNTYWNWRQFAPWILNLYWIGLSFMIVRLISGVYGCQRLSRNSITIKDPKLQQVFRELSCSLRLTKIPTLAQSNQLVMPSVLGVLRPVVLIPLSLLTQLTASQIESILAHELAHVKRLDPLFLLIQRFCESILFFHPIVWWMSRHIELLREECCDELAVSSGLDRKDYAEALVRFSEIKHLDQTKALALSAGGGKHSQLLRRVQCILGKESKSHMRLSRSGLFGIITSVVFLGLFPLTWVFASWTTISSQLNNKQSEEVGFEEFDQNLEHRPKQKLDLENQEGPHQVNQLQFQPNQKSLSKTSWTSLHAWNSEGEKPLYRLVTHVTVNGEFPVMMNNEPERFRVRITEGNDQQITTEIYLPQTKEPLLTLSLIRDQPLDFQINEKEYSLLYPTSHIAKGKNNISDKAMLILSYHPSEEYRAVRIYCANDQSIYFQGKKTSWDQVSEWLKEVQDRPELVLEMAVESESHILVSDLNKYQYKLGQLANHLDFKYGSYVGEHSIESDLNYKTLTLKLSNGGGIQFENELIPPKDLGKRLKEYIGSTEPEKLKIIIRAQEEVSYEMIGNMIQFFKRFGVSKIYFQGEVGIKQEIINRQSQSAPSDQKMEKGGGDQMVQDILQRVNPEKRQQALVDLPMLLNEQALTKSRHAANSQGEVSGEIQEVVENQFGEEGIILALQVLRQTSDIPYDRHNYLPSVRKLLKHENPSIRAGAIRVLPSLKPETSDLDRVFTLIETESEPRVKQEIAFTLFALNPKLEDSRLTDALLNLLNDLDDAVVKQTIRNLWGHNVSPEVESVLIDLSNSKTWAGDTIYYALSTRPLMRRPVCERLIKALKHPDWNVSGRAAWGLSHHELTGDSIDLVVKALSDTFDHSLNRYIRDNCLYGLKMNPTDVSVLKLRDIANNDENETYRKRALDALEGLK